LSNLDSDKMLPITVQMVQNNRKKNRFVSDKCTMVAFLNEFVFLNNSMNK